MDSRVKELVDFDELVKNINKATKSDPLANSIFHKLDGANVPKGWELMNRVLQFWDQCYVLDRGTLQLQVVHNHHDHPTTRHFGEARTLELVHQEFHWPGLWKTVTEYIKSCVSCTQAKVPHHKPYGKLKQLLIPSCPWSLISMDFIKQLPISDGFSTILVIVNRLTKQVIFIPTYDTVDAPGVA